MKKVLYLMRGEHTDPSCTEQENAQSRQCYRICTELTCEIARKARKIFYFSDLIDESGAQFYNSVVRQFAANKDNQAIYEMLAEAADEIYAPELLEEVEMFSQLLKQGIDISYMRTEDDFDIMETLRQAVERREISIRGLLGASIYIANGGEPELLMFREDEIGNFLLKYRDANIFDNVVRHAGEVNVLFVGLDHQLSEFDKREHSFTIYPVRAEWSGDAVLMEESLPKSYKRFIKDLQKKYSVHSSML